jgi:hypothetical protein
MSGYSLAVALNAMFRFLQVPVDAGGPGSYEDYQAVWQAMYSARSQLFRDSSVRAKSQKVDHPWADGLTLSYVDDVTMDRLKRESRG